MQPEQLAATDPGARFMPLRLVPQQGEAIDRERLLEFFFNGKKYRAYQGDTVAAALLAAGVRRLRRSALLQRPRGVLCGAGHCDTCLVQVNGRANVRACRQPVKEGMEVAEQQSPGTALPQLAGRVLARLASLVQTRPNGGGPAVPKRSGVLKVVHADVAVVGGGPAGISAALAAERAGARVALFDENDTLGGHLRFAAVARGGAHFRPLVELRSALANREGIQVFKGSTVFDWQTPDELLAADREGVYRVRAAACVAATGGCDMPSLFTNNDLPGIFLGSGTQRLLNLYSVAPGRRVVVATANDDGWQVAGALHNAGVEVVGVVDERDGPTRPQGRRLAAQVPTYFWHTVVAARGRERVAGVEIACLDPHGAVAPGTIQSLPCDGLVVCVGFRPAVGLLQKAGAEFAAGYASRLPPGVFAAGRVNGTQSLDIQLIEGEIAGQAAAAVKGHGEGADSASVQALKALKAAEKPSVSRYRGAPAADAFVCTCTDLRVGDVDAPDDGARPERRLCGGRTCARASEPFVAAPRSAPLLAASRLVEPLHMERLLAAADTPHRLPLDGRHAAAGGQMAVEDGWLVPRHYGDVAAEVAAVRRGVGLFDRSHLACLEVDDGAGLVAFARGWSELGPGRAALGLVVDGTAVGEGVAAHLDDGRWRVWVLPSTGRRLAQRLQERGTAFRARGEEEAVFALCGPGARALLAALPQTSGADRWPYGAVQRLSLAEVPCLGVRLGYADVWGCQLHVAADYADFAWEFLQEAGQAHGLKTAGTDTLALLRLEQGSVAADGLVKNGPVLPLYGRGRWGWQRLDAGGGLLQLAPFEAPAGPLPLDGELVVEVRDKAGDRALGWIERAAYSPTFSRPLGMAWVPAEQAVEGASFNVRSKGRHIAVRLREGLACGAPQAAVGVAKAL